MLGHVWTMLKDVTAALHRRPARWSEIASWIRGNRLIAPVALLAASIAVPVHAAPPDSPLVAMNVTLPSGEVKALAAHDSETVTFSTPEGITYGVRPTVQDSKPWTRTVVTFFRMPTEKQSTEEIGAVEARTGAGAVTLKGSPAFKVAVATVTADPVSS
jgi:hypothetical protein